MSLSSSALDSALRPHLERQRWVVAYSGGQDSSVLLDLLHRYLAAQSGPRPQLSALHINHGLSPQADAWQSHCEGRCGELGIPFTAAAVQVRPERRASLEAIARRARYAAYQQHLQAGDLLLQAHHRDDQVETLLLRLCRGTGGDGLAGVPTLRALGESIILRPLLEVDREAIADYAQAHGLHWIEDESNADQGFDRNYLRHEVLPRLAQRWPGLRATWARAARLAEEARTLNRALAALDLETVARGEVLALEPLAALSPERRRNLLRYWLRTRGLPPPSGACLAAVEKNMLEARPDARPLACWGQAELHRHQGELYAMQRLPAPAAGSHPWSPDEPLILPGMGKLIAHPIKGEGLKPAKTMTVRFRTGGERCTPLGRSHSKTLKKLLQERSVPPWLRDRMPLIYQDGELAAVADLWVCRGYSAAGQEEGLRLRWLPPGAMEAGQV